MKLLFEKRDKVLQINCCVVLGGKVLKLRINWYLVLSYKPPCNMSWRKTFCHKSKKRCHSIVEIVYHSCFVPNWEMSWQVHLLCVYYLNHQILLYNPETPPLFSIFLSNFPGLLFGERKGLDCVWRGNQDIEFCRQHASAN